MPYGSKTVKVIRSRKYQKKLNKREISQVKRIVGLRTEDKYYDQIQDAISLVNTGLILGGLVIPVQGTGVKQRVGDSIMMKSLRVKYNIVAGDQNNAVRVMLVQWHDTNSINAPSLSKIAENTIDNLPFFNYNYTNYSQNVFRVLYDKIHVVGTSGGGLPYALTRTIFLTGKKLGRKKIDFNPGVVTGDDQYYFIVAGDSGGVPHPNISYTSRAVYTDA